jgi:anthranilate phosphoribosyltransferase
VGKNLIKLHRIDGLLAKLVDGQSLTIKEAEKLTYNIFVYDTDGMHFATWVGAIHAKGETAEELAGFLNATSRLAVKFKASDFDIGKTTDLSGTGGGSFKTINVSTIASFVVAAAGYTVAKEAYYAVTSPTGSADMFTVFGVDFQKLKRKQIEKALKEVGICPIMASCISPRLENRVKLTNKFYVERQVRVRSPFHLASNLYSPLPMKRRIYGCYSKQHLEVLANLFKKLGYERTLTFYAEIGIPELSNVGKTTIFEQNGNKIKKYIVKPADLGVKETSEKEIKTGGKEQNIKDFVKILQGKERGAKTDLVAINAGASFYSLGDVKTLKAGTIKAQRIITDGTGYEIFKRLIGEIGSNKLLEKWE